MGSKEIQPKTASKLVVAASVAFRLMLCPGDDILAATTAATLGVISPDGPKQGILPEPIRIVSVRNKNGNDPGKDTS